MYIENIKIGSFGKLSKREFDLTGGVNVIEGKNESGKTTLSEFIKFIFYGLSNKQNDGELSERKRHISWKTNEVSGSIVINDGEKRYRIERSMVAHGAGYKDNLNVVDLETNSPISDIKCPGEHFFGIPEEVFVSTVYIRQADGAYFKGESIGQAVENIFYSADESVNTTKAIKKLDEARVQIKHKKNTGRGMLDSLEKERDELSVRLVEARAATENILQTESSLRNTLYSIEKNKKECEAMAGQMRKIEIGLLLEKFDERKKFEDNIDNFKEGKNNVISATTFNGFFPDESYEVALVNAKSELNYLKTNADIVEEVFEFDSSDETYYTEKAAVLEEMGGRWDIDDTLSALKSKKKTLITSSVMFGVITLIIAVFGLLFGKLLGGLALIPVLCGIASAVTALIILVMAFRANGRIGEIYSIFGVNDEESLFDMIDKIEEKAEAAARRKEIFEYNKIKKSEDDKKLFECIGKTTGLLSRWGIVLENNGYDETVQALDNALSNIAEIKKNIALYDKEIEKNEALKGVMDSQLAGYDEEKLREEFGMLNCDCNAENVGEIKKRYDFTVLARENLTEKQTELEKKLAELRAKNDVPSEIESRLKVVNDSIESLTAKYDAYVLAIEKLTTAADSLRGKLAPGLSAKAGGFMDGLTDGKYKEIGVSDKLAMTYSFEDEGATYTKDIDYVSAGTKDIAYVSLRLALADTFADSGHRFPIIFDEAFARLDDGRLKKMLCVADKYARKESQTVIFTSQTREAEFMKELFGDEGFNYISM